MKTADRKLTTDHDEIRRWAEARQAHPATVKPTQRGGQHADLLRLDFPGYSGKQSLEPISWDEFFKKFEESHLALLYQDKTAAGKPSNFNKLINREKSPKRKPASRPKSKK